MSSTPENDQQPNMSSSESEATRNFQANQAITTDEIKSVLTQLENQAHQLKRLSENNTSLQIKLSSLLTRATASDIDSRAPESAQSASSEPAPSPQAEAYPKAMLVDIPAEHTVPVTNVPKQESIPTPPQIQPAEESLKEEKSVTRRIPPQLTNLPFALKYRPEAKFEPFELSPNDTKAILNEFNDTDFEVTESSLLHKLFEEIAEKQADIPALVHDNQFLTFEELNQQANQMARYLRARGIFQEETIGISLPRSIDLIVTMLAVLKSGCTYIHIDPKETSKRLKFITFNADIQAIVTLSDYNEKFEALGSSTLKIINLDQEKGEMSEMESSNLDVLFSPITPTHILYSSSPIKPVGIPFYSKTVLNELNWLWNNYPFGLREIACQIASPSRIEFVTEIWAPLLKGITNILVPDEIVLDPERFVDFLTEIHVTRLQLPPSILAMMLITVPDLGDRLPQLETWFLRGEILHAELIKFFKEVVPGKKIVNIYNITEGGGIVASFESNIKTDSKGICLGLPIDNVKIYLLDDEGRRVKPGEAGQIAVSSFGTETGYLKNPILTKNYFTEDTLTRKLKGPRKLYVTGDYGRLTADGYLEYLGRKDNLIKYYGNKIDLDDISRVLMKQEEVNEAVMEPESNRLGQLVLSTFLLVNDQTYSVQNWRKYLLKQMPEYMVPTQIYQVKSSDRRSKSSLNKNTMQMHVTGFQQLQAEREHNQARDDVETGLVELLQQILNREDVFVDDDFFELGGNYIQTHRFKNRIQDEFGISLPADIVYRKPTVSGLASVLRESIRFKEKEASVSNADFVESFTQKIKVLSKEAVMDKNKVLEIQVGLPDRPKFFCVHGEDGDISYLRYWIKHLGEQPFYSFQPSTITDGKKEAFKSLEEIASDYIKEMQKLQPRGPYFLGGYSAGGVIAYEMAQQLTLLGEKIACLILIDTINPILTQTTPSLRNRFENLAAAPAAYFNRSLFKKLTEQNFGKSLYGGGQDVNSTLISPNFRKVFYEEGLSELINNYRIKPYTGSILLISSSESAAAMSHASFDRGWKGYALSLKIHEIQGDRHSLIKESNAKKVVQAIHAYVKSVSKKNRSKKLKQTA